MKHLPPFALLVSPLFLAAAAPAATLLGPSPYLSATDSPFLPLPPETVYSYLEDFEDGALNTPGVTANAGTVLFPGALADSVDGDGGSIDGSGTTGHSWYSAGSTFVLFTFDSAALGGLPTFAGIVWTDVGFSDDAPSGPPFIGDITFEAFGAGGASLGTVSLNDYGDGAAGGGTAEDRFFGLFHDAGIESIRLSMNSTDWEMDHLQYARVVPEGGTAAAALVLAGLGALALRRRLN
ncbi:MAG: hypothetical protein ACKVYV_13025 [Limisphaerales bacterium]